MSHPHASSCIITRGSESEPETFHEFEGGHVAWSAAPLPGASSAGLLEVGGEAQPPLTRCPDLPPACDTGVDHRVSAEVSFSLHWLRYSLSLAAPEVCERIGGGWSDGLPGGAFNQPRHLVHESGAKLFYGSARLEQPLVLEVSGDVCETHADEFVKHGAELGGRCTRFDVAADIGPDELTMRRWRELRRDFRAGRCVTRIPTTSGRYYHSDREGDGSTAYYGATTSEVMLRVYTRRGPLRMEYQVKPTQPAARGAWARRLNECNAGEVWRHFGRKTQWPAEWFMRVLNGDAATVERVPDEVRSYEQIIEQMRTQMGPTLWMLHQLDVPMSDLLRKPINPNGQWLATVKRIAREADAAGRNGARLLRAAERVAASRKPR